MIIKRIYVFKFVCWFHNVFLLTMTWKGGIKISVVETVFRRCYEKQLYHAISAQCCIQSFDSLYKSRFLCEMQPWAEMVNFFFKILRKIPVVETFFTKSAGIKSVSLLKMDTSTGIFWGKFAKLLRISIQRKTCE